MAFVIYFKTKLVDKLYLSEVFRDKTTSLRNTSGCVVV